MSKQNYFKSNSDQPVKIVQRGSGGIGFFGLLTVLFVGLKLAGVITWPWLIVICPIFVPLLLGLAVFAFCVLVGCTIGLVAAIHRGFKWLRERRKR